MNKYIYANNLYDTIDEVQEAVTAMKTRLDNNPTDWCVVKPMINPRTIAIYSGDVIGYDSGEPLTDVQIKALGSSNNLYNIYSVYEGDNFTEVSEDYINQKVEALRTPYARRLELNKYFYVAGVMEGEVFNPIEEPTVYNVTNEDMSGYV
tara:strand:+ start:65 stop:514 length:450 start_codon:yes stop_codon:yes gene_type:complete